MSGDLLADLAALTEPEPAVAVTGIEVPKSLPVEHLSHSSINLLRMCPEKWRRRYLLREYEPPSGNLIVGKATHGAAAVNYGQKIESGTDLSTADVLDAYADEWKQQVAESENIDWGDAHPEAIRDTGAETLKLYHQLIAPETQPVSVERQFTLHMGDADWTFTGYIDLEEKTGAVSDLKSKGRRLLQKDADSDMQAGSYLLARRSEGNPASGFNFHTLVRKSKPEVEVIRTKRSDGQLDSVAHRIVAAAREIAWRAEYDVWDGAPPGSWLCSNSFCGYWDRCRFGGLR